MALRVPGLNPAPAALSGRACPATGPARLSVGRRPPARTCGPSSPRRSFERVGQIGKVDVAVDATKALLLFVIANLEPTDPGKRRHPPSWISTSTGTFPERQSDVPEIGTGT